MTPLHFEELYRAEWTELEGLLDQLLQRKQAPRDRPIQGERVAVLYRRACEHLALARARSYPAYILNPLERLTADAHQVIYQRREFGLAKVRHFFSVEFPASVRANAGYIWLAAALFYIPGIVIGWLMYARPELILSVVSAALDLLKRYHKRALVIIITNFRDEDSSELGYALRLLRTRHLVMLASLRERIVGELMSQPMASADAMLDIASAHLYEQSRRDAFNRLADRGPLTIDAEPDQLGVQLVNRYHAVKRAGMI